MSGCWEQACERVSNTQSWGGRQCAGDGLGGRSLRPGLSGRGSLCVPTLRLTAVVEEQLAADQAVLPERETPLFIRPRVALPSLAVDWRSVDFHNAAQSGSTGVAQGVPWHSNRVVIAGVPSYGGDG